MDTFGKELPKPPAFLVTIQAMDDPSITTETILKIPVILNGVDTKESKLFIVRTFEGTLLSNNYNLILKIDYT